MGEGANALWLTHSEGYADSPLYHPRQYNYNSNAAFDWKRKTNL